MVFRARDVLVRQRTQCINALRGATNRVWLGRSQGHGTCRDADDQIEDPNCSFAGKPPRAIFRVMVSSLTSLEESVAVLDSEISRRSKEDPVARLD